MPQPNCIDLVLDAGPLLSQKPLRGIATTYYTVPQVISELRDQKAREHVERLALVAGINIQTRVPDSASMLKVIACAKKSGDYSVLSQPDLAVLALTLSLHEKHLKLTGEQAVTAAQEDQLQKEGQPVETPNAVTASSPTQPKSFAAAAAAAKASQPSANLVTQLADLKLDEASHDAETEIEIEVQEISESESEDEQEESDDGEGEWITPDNVGRHKARGLDLIPDDADATPLTVPVGCMTADYAMQNVLLHLGLNLLDVEGRRISTVKTWVLRCHACFKLCKDSSKKFCPTCGNATLLRTSITTHAPKEPGGAPIVQVHLKRNFQYRLRGSKYSIPTPKRGSAKHGAASALILREDQQEWQRAVRKENIRQEKDERKMLRSLESGRADGGWNDPDWIPEMLVGTRAAQGGLPAIGHGRRNPNERRRKR